MTIGEEHLERYNKESQKIIDEIDEFFAAYTNYIKQLLHNYYPDNKWDTDEYVLFIDIENMLNFNKVDRRGNLINDDDGNPKKWIRFTNPSMNLGSYPSYERVIKNYKARLHLAKKLNAWLLDFVKEEKISYKITNGEIIFNLIKEQEND